MTDSATTAWTPILVGNGRATVAWAAIDAVSRAIVEGDFEPGRSRGEDHVLLYAYLAATQSDEQWAVRATEQLNGCIEAASARNWFALYGGLSGLGWTIEHVSGLLDKAFPSADDAPDDDDGDDTDLNAEIDAAILGHLHAAKPGTWLEREQYDLVSGLAGYGTYFLERWPNDAAATGIGLVLDHLSSAAERSAQGITWHTPASLLPEWQRAQCPRGYYNLGVAHGVPGVIHFLSEAISAGIHHDSAELLLDGALRWLMGSRLPPGAGSWFSAWFTERPMDGCRLAWCYGDLGVVSVLLQVARRTGRGDVHRFACDLLDHCLERHPDSCGVADAPLCHGAAGLAHFFNRIYQTEGHVGCRDASLAWFDRALAMRQPTTRAGGFLASTRPDLQGPIVWEASPAFLDGAIGVALALLAGVSTIEPNWDRLLLASGRPWPKTPHEFSERR